MKKRFGFIFFIEVQLESNNKNINQLITNAYEEISYIFNNFKIMILKDAQTIILSAKKIKCKLGNCMNLYLLWLYYSYVSK